MADIKLNTATYDIDVTNHEFTVIGEDEAIAQQLGVRMRYFLGEWFLDTAQGIPFYRDILVKNPNTSLVREIFRDVIESTPGIARVVTLSLDLQAATRQLNITFKALLDSGEELEYAPFILEI